MSGAYFYNEHLRWSFLWENPNCWAAFLSCLIAWLWCGQDALCAKSQIPKSQIPNKSQITNDKISKQQKSARNKNVRAILGLITLYIVEAGIWFLLVKTYSRGGLVAAVVAMVFFFVLCGTGRKVAQTAKSASGKFFRSRLGSLRYVAIRIALIAVLCLAAGFASRMSPAYAMQDKSILNRVDQWKAALVMIHDSPFHGWGYTLGGMMYQNWYQPLSHTTRPIGFVNSYLEVAVEQGSQVLFLAVVLACALLLIAVKLRKVSWVAAAGASLVAWLTSNLWSSIWLWPGLWILSSVAALCIMVAAGLRNHKLQNPKSQKNPKLQITNLKGRDYVASVAGALAAGIVVWVSIIGAGHVLAKGFPFQARPVARGDAAIVARRGDSLKSTELSTELWVDAAVTGRYWGKAIRTILENNPCGGFIVYAPWALRENRLGRPTSKCVYSGFQAELLSDKDLDRKSIIILHPTVYPPATIPTSGQHPKITVCLPAFDASPYNLPWRRWAAENGAKLVFSPQDGKRIDPDQNREFWRALLFNE